MTSKITRGELGPTQLRVLEVMRSRPRPLPLGYIARAAGLESRRTANVLYTLGFRGLVVRTERGRYETVTG